MLPVPHPREAAHGARVTDRIRREIAHMGGSITFSRYMELALHAPGLGYYSAGLQKFGRDGDFVTAPELAPAFSRCVAGQIREVYEALGSADAILEFGAGSGVMAAELMLELASLDALPDRYLILETSADLRARQRALLQRRLGPLMDRFSWLDTLPRSRFSGVVIANEVLDTFPAARMRLADGATQEWYVGWEDNRFAWYLDALSEPGLARAVESIVGGLPHELPPGYVLEVRTNVEPWLREVAGCLSRGLVLLMDYGYPRHEYYHPQRGSGTLTCFYRHRAHGNPLVLTGLQDISVHVDFTGVAEAGDKCGLEINGFTTQAHFLLASGLLETSTGYTVGTPAHRELAHQIRQLTLPGEMGEIVKIMALTRGIGHPLGGFSGLDLRARL